MRRAHLYANIHGNEDENMGVALTVLRNEYLSLLPIFLLECVQIRGVVLEKECTRESG